MRNLTRSPLLLALTLVVLFAWGCGGGGPGGKNSSDPEIAVDLIVTQVYPVNGQEVLSDLSDAGGPDGATEPGEPGVITVKFSEKVATGSILDPANTYTGLTSNVNILDSAFARVPGFPDILPTSPKILTFAPQGSILPSGQYTVTVSRDVRNFQGGRLNNGRYDHRSSFTVGTDTFSPVIRNTFPAPNQTEVPKDAAIVITMNESVNPATVTTATVNVVDGGANPPVPINGTLTTGRDDFEIIFLPDPVNPMPANATIVVTILGGASGITDAVGNPFEGDPATPPTYQFQFSTVTEPPDPNMPLTIDTLTPDALVEVSTRNDIVALRENAYILNTADLTQWGTGNPIEFSRRHIGSPGESVFDPRFGALDGHTWVYVVDEAGRDVVIVGTRNNKVVYRWKNLADPRGLGIQFSGDTLYATNFSNNSVSVIDIGRANVGDPVASEVTKSLTTPDGGIQAFQVGVGPLGVAHSPDQLVLVVANQLDSSATVINTATLTEMANFVVGTNPQDVAVTFIFNVGWFAFVSCKGGGTDEDGSVALYWSAYNSLQANVTGFKNPQGIEYDYGLSTWVANSGGGTTAQLTLTVVGGAFAATILPQITAEVKVGNNPTDVCVEPFYTALTLIPAAAITTDRGSGELTFVDAQQPSRPTFKLPIKGSPWKIAGWVSQ